VTARDGHRTQRRAEELARIRRGVVDAVCIAVQSLQHTDAESALTAAQADKPQQIRGIDSHLTEFPDAFTSPSGPYPAAFDRLLRVLAAAGHDVAVPACIGCGRTDVPLRHRTPHGRQCQQCSWNARTAPCGRCGHQRPVARRTDQGPLCRPCYRADPATHRICARCGKQRPPDRRREDGTHLCRSCAHVITCARCGRTRANTVHTPDGPVCRSCNPTPKRRCGYCGRDAEIVVRGKDGHPDRCRKCYTHRRADTCVVCGRVRQGSRYQRTAFHCQSCWPRQPRECADCGQITRPHATWPMGTICRPCYLRRARHPQPCHQCHTLRVLVGRSDTGQDLCGPCSGAPHLNFTCLRCRRPGDIYADGLCSHCVGSDRVRALLTDPDTGTVPQPLAPLLDALATVNGPSLVKWVKRSATARLLGTWVADKEDISHESLDRLPQVNTTREIRQTLVTAGVLAERDEPLAQQQLWVATFLDGLPAPQQRVLRPYAEWQILRRARRKARRGRYVRGSSRHDRRKLRAAAQFLDWLDAIGVELASVGQTHLDDWITAHTNKAGQLAPFLAWTSQRRLTSALEITVEPHALPSRFLTDHEYREQLRRCMHDDSIPIEARVVAALVRLYGLPVSRILVLTVDRFHHDGEHAYLTIDEHPVLLPPILATLIQELIGARAPSMLQPIDGPRYLLPGRPPSQPRSQGGIGLILNRNGLPTLAARNTAMIESAGLLPAVVLSDLFGISIATAHQWTELAAASWAEYLAADSDTAKTR